MTIDIEKERLEFEAEFHPYPHDGKYWIRQDKAGNYCSPEMESSWQGWLAAKRASVGSVEPVMFAFKHSDGTWHDASMTENSIGMRPLFEAPPSTDVKDAFIDNLPKPIYRNKHAGGTVGYLATEHYNEGWNDCLEAMRGLASQPDSQEKAK